MPQTPNTDFAIRRLEAPDDRHIAGLADILIDCVKGGASVSFMLPISASPSSRMYSPVPGPSFSW